MLGSNLQRRQACVIPDPGRCDLVDTYAISNVDTIGLERSRTGKECRESPGVISTAVRVSSRAICGQSGKEQQLLLVILERL